MIDIDDALNAPQYVIAKQAYWFLDDADKAWLDAADRYNLCPAMAEALLLESLIKRCFRFALDETRSLLTARLAELNCPENTVELVAAVIARKQAYEALVLKRAEQNGPVFAPRSDNVGQNDA